MANQWLKQYCQFCISQKSAKAALTKAFSVMMFSVCIGGGLNSPAFARTTTADFLKWEKKAQEAFLQNSISMAGVIAAQSKPEIAKCIDKWYFTNAKIIQQRNDEILNYMPQLKNYSPATVVLAIINDVCGKI